MNSSSEVRSPSGADSGGDLGATAGATTRANARSTPGTDGRSTPGTDGRTGARAGSGTDTPTTPQQPGSRANSRTGAALALRAATLGRPGAPVLDGVDLDVSSGEILTVVGPSGCGKSTLLRTLAGLLSPLAGEVTQDGRPLTGPSADRALVFQDDALLPWRTLRANIELPLAIKGLPRAERRTQAAAWLDRVGLTAQTRQLPHRVSGGQRQRAQLARALAGAPRAVLMDEPFGALDAQTRAGMQDLLVEVLLGTGATVVFVTHDVDEALYLGDRVALIGADRLVAVREVPHPRDRAAHDDPARVALRRDVLSSLGT
ncbi:ABC transporter ATP-binding protein [Streptomyces sp. NPDC005492]|uniref:ABC transporter ATP-binding protein n=1 Tax=Streptomyces sp. NPDC005492 TaxID=3156883 RepID=UPI0033BAF16D